ncbi:P2Y purinoceptor 2-like [Silurus meridionalis]|uniref:P2Y purinoceptor 2 n=2 Tax=Silurus meridionalis TaxID=175797 RepID=A0A8T0AZW9_SILME|nr:hypothetical protein HF521_003982 [Silurus meridionalis]KAI5098360.1 P2Y purinoceptor 2-like [Silurus meridionalis]
MAAQNVTRFTNNTSQYDCKFNEDFKYILLPVSYGLVFLVGLILNITALYSILFRIKHWSPNTIYMINLTVCDTLYILTLPFLIYYYADKNDWPFTEVFCKMIRFLFYTNLYGSILFLSCISIHRFLGICHPVRSMQWVNARRARYVSVLVWVIVLTFQAPVLYFSRTTHQVCHDTTSQALFNYFMVYSSVISVILFVIPFVLVLVCNGLMVRKLLETTTIGGATSQRSKQKSVKMIVIVLLVFILCFLPFHLTRSLYYSFRYFKVNCTLLEGSNVAYKVMRPLASVNSCFDPILYFMAGQGFRQSVSKKLKQLSCIKMDNQNKTNCTFTEDINNILLPVTYSVVLAVGLPLNLIAMIAILFWIKHWSPITVYMINLFVCDTLYILTLPFLIYYHAVKKLWPFTEGFCKLIRFLFYTNLYGSILFLCCINVHRFIVVCHPVRSMGWFNTRRASYVSALVWVVVFCFQTPVLYFSRTDTNGTICKDTTTNELFEQFLQYSSVVSVFFFLIPFILVIVCNSLMVQRLIQPNAVGRTSQHSKQKSIKMISIVLIVFIVCFLPFHLTRTFHYYSRHFISNCSLRGVFRMAYKVSRPLACINCCIDPILYFMAGQGFRRSIPKKIKQQVQKSDEDKGLSNSQSD